MVCGWSYKIRKQIGSLLKKILEWVRKMKSITETINFDGFVEKKKLLIKSQVIVI